MVEAEDAAAAMEGNMSVVIWRATALVPSWSFLPVGVKRLSICRDGMDG